MKYLGENPTKTVIQIVLLLILGLYTSLSPIMKITGDNPISLFSVDLGTFLVNFLWIVATFAPIALVIEHNFFKPPYNANQKLFLIIQFIILLITFLLSALFALLSLMVLQKTFLPFYLFFLIQISTLFWAGKKMRASLKKEI